MLMQQLAIGIVLIVSICAWRRFKATVLVWMVAQTLINAQISVRYESPAMSCVLATDIALLAIYYIKYRHSRRVALSRDRFLFHTPLVALMASYVVTMIIAPIFTLKGCTTAIKYVVSNFAMLYLFQKCLASEKDIKLFMRSAVVAVLMQTLLGLSQAITHDNIWLDFVYWNSPHDENLLGRMFYMPGMADIRYGLVRCQSFFGIHIAFGVFCVLYFYLMMNAYLRKWGIVKKWVLSVCVILALTGVFIANSKTGYVGLVVILFSLYRPRQLFNVKALMPILLIIICVLLYFPEYLNNYFSLFDKDIAKYDGGSTVSLREMQFHVALDMFKINPVFGNGLGSIGVIRRSMIGGGDILGAESSWMQIMPERGIVGAMTYIIMYWSLYKVFSREMGKRTTFFYLLAVLVMETATGLLDMSIWGAVLVVIYRHNQLAGSKEQPASENVH